MPDTKRQRILDKIRKLQCKTTTLGCTEAEALAAAQAIGRLLDAYGLTMTDVELQTTTCVEDAVLSPFVSNRHPIRYCLRALSGYCHTAYFFRQQPIDEDGTTWRTAYYFFGLPHDVEVAVYLTQVIMAALERESASFKRTAAYRQLVSGGKREVAYPVPADKYFGPLASRLSGVNQLVSSPSTRFSICHRSLLSAVEHPSPNQPQASARSVA